MDEYFIGEVKSFQKGKIIFQSGSRGFILQGVHLHLLALNQSLKLYVYFYQRLPISEYFAFLDQETKQYFLQLISISYVGPKIALKILNFFPSCKEFQTLIAKQDSSELVKINGVTIKLAQAIIKHFKSWKIFS